MIVSTGDLTPKLLEEVVRQEICGQPQDRETEASTVGERGQLTDHSQPLAVAGIHLSLTAIMTLYFICLQEAMKREREREERRKREFERRMNPRTKEDFELLYHALESTSLQ